MIHNFSTPMASSQREIQKVYEIWEFFVEGKPWKKVSSVFLQP